MTGGKTRILLLAGAVIIVVILTVARVSKKRPPESAPPAERPYPVYATPEELMRDHEKAFKYFFDGGRTLKSLLGDYYVCLAFRDKNPGQCDVVDSWMIAKLSPPMCRMRYYEANMFKEIFTSEAPPPTCLALAKLMNLVGAQAEELCTNKEVQQAVRKGDVKRFCAQLRAAGIAPPPEVAPCEKELVYVSGRPEVCGDVEDPVMRGVCESRASMVKALREGKSEFAATYAYGPLVGADPAAACKAVGKRALDYYEMGAAGFVQVQRARETDQTVSQKYKTLESEGANKQRLAKEDAERANAEREKQAQDKIRKMIEETKASQAEKDRKAKEEAEAAAQKQKQIEEERKTKLAQELEDQKRKRDADQLKAFEQARKSDAEKKAKLGLPFTEFQVPPKKAPKKAAPKAGAEEDTP